MDEKKRVKLYMVDSAVLRYRLVPRASFSVSMNYRSDWVKENDMRQHQLTSSPMLFFQHNLIFPKSSPTAIPPLAIISLAIGCSCSCLASSSSSVMSWSKIFISSIYFLLAPPSINPLVSNKFNKKLSSSQFCFKFTIFPFKQALFLGDIYSTLCIVRKESVKLTASICTKSEGGAVFTSSPRDLFARTILVVFSSTARAATNL
mmetsp:Transcript_21285/g.48346  ORF Transcript_21285/g.48346 Transcript_21285/m.48346 type:complete len:204 (+) Transcript_21285:635-1246(+)